MSAFVGIASSRLLWFQSKIDSPYILHGEDHWLSGMLPPSAVRLSVVTQVFTSVTGTCTIDNNSQCKGSEAMVIFRNAH